MHGNYRVVLDIGSGLEIPFTANFTEDHRFEFYNGEEVVSSEETEIRGDSIIIRHPVFEGTLKGRFTATEVEGDFVKESLNRVVPFKMTFGDIPRFEVAVEPQVNVSGYWETVFSDNNPAERYEARGEFVQSGNSVSGTFRTNTGDYRYLEGVVDGDSLKLSTFDTAHAFLFLARVTDSTMTGMFYSGNHFEEPFEAIRNAQYELPDPEKLTYLKEGYEGISFEFPDLEGNMVSLDDPRFEDKVLVLQIMGSWCPNCLDETKYLSEFYSRNNSDQLEIVALAFEIAPTQEKAFESLERLIDGASVPYPVLLAQYSGEDKLEAAKKLPMLNHVLSYPTTIFIDRNRQVRKIHTGFNGPATGIKYELFKTNFEKFVDSLLAE